jgi:cell shape-determining protein MreC
VSNFEQTAVLPGTYTGVVMERLKYLYREYEENQKLLSHPFDLADLEQLKECRRAILREARALAKTLKISEPQWFSIVN